VFKPVHDNPLPEDGADVPTPPVADGQALGDTILPSMPHPLVNTSTSSVASFNAFAFEFAGLLRQQEQHAASAQAKSEQLARDLAGLEETCKSLQEKVVEATLAKETLANELVSQRARESAAIKELQLRNDMLEKKCQARYYVLCFAVCLIYYLLDITVSSTIWIQHRKSWRRKREQFQNKVSNSLHCKRRLQSLNVQQFNLLRKIVVCLP
jgi:hypothetical protein